MLLGPHDLARRIEHRHRPGWVVWYGRHTRQYWALASWVRTPHAMLAAATLDEIEAAIAGFELLHPKPRPHHALVH
jgi:hypothetical protein